MNDPAVNTQPASTNLPPGATATFTVMAGGTPALSYQWIKNDTNLLVNGTNISGATSPTLTITSVSPADAGNYTVAVTNGLNNSVISAPAVMTVIDPAITTEPQSRTNDYGTTATFSVAAAGTGPFTYQWLRSGTNLSNGGNVSGVASATLALTAVSYLDAGSYSVIVSNSLGNSVTSSTVTLTVKDPIITAQPSSKIAIGGTTTSFTVGAAGSSLSFIWKKGTAVLSNGGNISGANTATLMISALSATDPANYSVIVSNPASGQTVTSSTVNLSVVNPLTPRTVAVGDTIVFAPLVTGTPPFTYQWTKAGSPIAGQTSTSYTKSNVQVSDSDTYAVGVTNPAGSVTVSAALIVSATGLNLNPTNLIVLRQGDGIQAIASTGNTLFLDQFTTSGTYVNTVSIPDSGPSALIQNGTAPTEGYINLSLNRGVLTLVGFNVTRPWTSGLGNTASVDVPRAIATVDAAANYTLVVSSTNAFSGNNIRSAITDGANNYWVSGGGSGTRYFRPGSADNVSIQTTINNTRVLQIFSGDLYFSAAATSWGIHKFAGLPTAAAAESDVLLTGNNTSSPYDYVLDSSGTNMYLTEDGSASTNIYVPGIVKWTYNTGTATWNSNYTLLPGTGTRGLTADLKVNPPVLYVTTTNGANDIANRLLAVQDTGPSAAATLLATAGPNQAFKGVRFGPLPVISATPDGARVILRWNGAYTLQSATNALGPYSDIPSATSPYTNSAYSPTKRFFRLRQ